MQEIADPVDVDDIAGFRCRSMAALRPGTAAQSDSLLDALADLVRAAVAQD